MRAIKLLGVSVLAIAASGSAAFAKITDQSKAGATSGPVAPLPKAGTLADNVVVTPRRAGACAGACARTDGERPAGRAGRSPCSRSRSRSRRGDTVVTQENPHNYVATVFVSALLGGLGGALIGGAIYYLDTPRNHPVQHRILGRGRRARRDRRRHHQRRRRREPRRTGGLDAPSDRSGADLPDCAAEPVVLVLSVHVRRARRARCARSSHARHPT